MSCSTARPLAPAPAVRRSACATSCSVCALGVKLARFPIRPIALSAGCVDRRHPGDVARLAEQQPSVLGDDPSRPPRHVVAGDAVDVRDVEGVAVDRDAGVRHGLCRDRLRAPAMPTGSGLKSLDQVRRRDVVEQRRQRVVHLCLLVGVGRRRRHRAVLARGDDVTGDDRVVGAAGAGTPADAAGCRDSSGRGRREHGPNGQDDDMIDIRRNAPPPWRSGRPLALYLLPNVTGRRSPARADS